jgi:sulfite exporter TauE/SafE/copper chaperone CopZ/plastocyanin domain-containing protein
MEKVQLTVKGMHCSQCEENVHQALKGLNGITRIKVDSAGDQVTFYRASNGASVVVIAEAIMNAGYQVSENRRTDGFPMWQILVILGIVASIGVMADRSGLLNRIPVVAASMSLGLVFVAGLLTSVHCIGMCGGICLSQSLTGATGKSRFSTPALYNLGRFMSYTTVGFLAGALGSVISPGLRVQGAIILAAGIFMMLFGLKIAGIIKIRLKLPGISGARLAGKGPLTVGILNGFLPCGPLQAVQLYALGSGSPWKGAAAMALFCLGTMPLLFSFGTVGNLLTGRFRKRVMQTGAMVILVMAAGMAIRGWNLAGLPKLGGPTVIGAAEIANIPVAVIGNDGIQRVRTQVTSSAYQPFVVQAGLALEWSLVVGPGELNGCNNPVTIPALGISFRLSEGENVISFTPGNEGRIGYTCWMGMINSAFYIVDDLESVSNELMAKSVNDLSDEANINNTDSCCSTTGSVLSGPTIADLTPEDVAIAEVRPDEDGSLRQHILVTVDENGYSPVILVLKRNLPANITFRSSGALNDASYRVSFPEYGEGIELTESADSTFTLVPEADFRYVSWQGDWIGIFHIFDDLEGMSPSTTLENMVAAQS